mmetsp:Transcript_20150/g.40017  ORF Transcript_20150/g.40017 Transcript_20150/m.40017 type:complete len:94 (+) Transcript_20150:463-744(+)
MAPFAAAMEKEEAAAMLTRELSVDVDDGDGGDGGSLLSGAPPSVASAAPSLLDPLLHFSDVKLAPDHDRTAASKNEKKRSTGKRAPAGRRVSV